MPWKKSQDSLCARAWGMQSQICSLKLLAALRNPAGAFLRTAGMGAGAHLDGGGRRGGLIALDADVVAELGIDARFRHARNYGGEG